MRLGHRTGYPGQNLVLVDQLYPVLGVPALEGGAHGVEDPPHLRIAPLCVGV